eukprot:GHVN01006726.1.p1 GENE.GHVN01006726.1~~GHVN01006726.1.p1  ORF type:complete len:174 (-),score=11.45 GHVN01006726.1:26-505(-)
MASLNREQNQTAIFSGHGGSEILPSSVRLVESNPTSFGRMPSRGKTVGGNNDNGRIIRTIEPQYITSSHVWRREEIAEIERNKTTQVIPALRPQSNTSAYAWKQPESWKGEHTRSESSLPSTRSTPHGPRTCTVTYYDPKAQGIWRYNGNGNYVRVDGR